MSGSLKCLKPFHSSFYLFTSVRVLVLTSESLNLRQDAAIHNLEVLHLLLQLRIHLVRDGHNVGKQLRKF
jgi:hypothetical protein